MKHECAGKVGGGGDHSGQVEVGTRRKQADLPIVQKVRFDRWCSVHTSPGQRRKLRKSSKPVKICQCNAEVRRGLRRKGADDENLSKSGW